jgi:uncharacterized protein
MKAIDTNILVYAHRKDSPWHTRAKAFLEAVLQADENIAVPYHCLIEFFGIVTNPRIFKKPTETDDALGQCQNLLDAPALALLTDSTESFDILAGIVKKARIQGSAVHDARVAALCLENGIRVIYTMDRDFSRFAPLKVENPLLP